MGFTSWFKGIGKQASSEPRALEYPRDLQIGDIVHFGFMSQQELSRKSFTVGRIVTYDLGPPRPERTVFELHGASTVLRLSVQDTSPDSRLLVSRTLLPDDVDGLFGIEKFAEIFEPDGGNHHTLGCDEKASGFEGWLSHAYYQEQAQQAVLITGDCRDKEHSQWPETGFDYYYFVSDDRNFALSAEVFDGGKTDVWLTVSVDGSALEEMYPAEGHE